jgi:preprotein translocase subunit SecD
MACCALIGCGRTGPKQYVTLAPETPPGAKADPSLVYLASDVITSRLHDVPGTEVTVKAGRISVGFPASTDRDWLVRMCTRRGELTFVLMPKELELAQPEAYGWKDTATGKQLPAADALKRGKVVFSGADLNGQAEVERAAQGGQWDVRFELRNQRKRAFRTFTHASVGRCLAIVLDDEVLMAPTIRSAIAGSGMISGHFTREEAEDLVRLMNSGPLPVALRVVDGQDESAKP